MLKLRIEDCKSLLILGISEPHTEILGGPSIFIEEGATMNLTCVVRDSPEPPQYIFWYRNSQVREHLDRIAVLTLIHRLQLIFEEEVLVSAWRDISKFSFI